MTGVSAPPVGAGDGTGRPFRLGFLTHVFGLDEPRALMRRMVELFVAAEELGFDSGWVAQHHFQTVYGRLPSPLVLLAAAAQATRRIDLGTAVVVLPLEDPVRLAEDAAVLDALSAAARGPAGRGGADRAAGDSPPRIATAHGVFPGPDRYTAARDLAPDIVRYRGFLTHYGLSPDADDQTTLEAMNIHHGPLETIVDSLAASPVGPGTVSTFITAVQGEAGGGADFDAVLRRLEIIATRIAPELGWRPAHRPSGRPVDVPPDPPDLPDPPDPPGVAAAGPAAAGSAIIARSAR